MKRTVTTLALALACLTVGALAGYAATSSGTDDPVPAKSAVRRPVEVRTVTIHRTVRVVRHEKKKRRRQPAPARAAAAVPAPPPAPAPVAAPTRAPVRSAPARPIASGSHSGGDDGGHHGHGGGGDDGGGDDE
jgi:hypothetical protein